VAIVQPEFLSMKHSRVTIGERTRDLRAYRAKFKAVTFLQFRINPPGE